ncbi:hypothetical protein C8R43DRAFT_1121333 [Mycena crocata]|nr:hypothetical protein C8R43DRAFT_1121333 [Mycena crocata]
MPPKIDLSALPPLDQIKGASIGSWNKTQLLAVAIALEIPMTDINYDFCQKEKDEGLAEEFWEKVNSTE